MPDIYDPLYPDRLKRNLAWGLEARWQELQQQSSAGYAADNTSSLRAELIHDAQLAHSMGLLSYLPTWAREV